MAVLKDVVFAYTKIQNAVPKAELNAQGKVVQSRDEYEFTVDCIISEKDAKVWKKKYKKQPPKEVDTENFEEIYKFAPPYPDQEEQFIVKAKKPATYKDKKTGQFVRIPDQYRPRVLLKGGEGKLEDITFTTLVANGSKGVVQLDEITNSFGTFAKLKAIRVDELIEYKSAQQDFSELGEVGELAEAPEQEVRDSSEESVGHVPDFADEEDLDKDIY